MSAQAVEIMTDDVLRRADEHLEVARHAVRMLRNPAYLAALTEPADEPGKPADEVLAKYL
jgi:hypothetical protein